ncbi:MAG: family 10 glycosylhydrolase [Cyanobacteria bacterium P01_A01_bin.123]
MFHFRSSSIQLAIALASSLVGSVFLTLEQAVLAAPQIQSSDAADAAQPGGSSDRAMSLALAVEGQHTALLAMKPDGEESGEESRPSTEANGAPIQLEISPESGLLRPNGVTSVAPLTTPEAETPQTTSSGTNASGGVNTAQRQPLTSEQRSRLLRQMQLNSEDPADQAEPPGLNVQPGNQPIAPFMALAMRQEMDNLMGRFESAYLLAASADQPSQLQLAAAAPILTASSEPVEVASGPTTALHPVLLEAQQLMQDWPSLMERREYAEARDRWLAIRRSLWENFPLDQRIAQPEIRAMWLDRGTIVEAGSKQRLAELFDRLQAAGINTVFFETINAGYPIYPSQIAPSQNPLTRHWDPLEAAVELAHERDMQLHAWIWTFAAGNQLHNSLLNLPTDYPGPILNSHPDWAAYDNQGSMIPIGQTKPFLDPANPEVRSYLTRLITEIVTTYDVDGLQLDYIRYPFQDPSADRTYGYGIAARREFHRLTGVDPINLSPRDRAGATQAERERERYLWNRWTEFRIQQVSSFVADAAQIARRHNPDIVISTAVFSNPTHERLQKIQQDWETWAVNGNVDWIVLMSYALDTARLEQLASPWLVNSDFNTTLVIPGIRLLNLSEPAAIDQIQALRDLPTNGYALFATANLNQAFETILNRTQGPADSDIAEPLPQQNPYQAALSRYQALQREWNLLLANQQIIMDESSLNRWITDANLLEEALQDLAENPSDRQLRQVQSGINQLQIDLLSSGITLRSASSTYRLETWQNRLTALERLIAYGEQRQ